MASSTRAQTGGPLDFNAVREAETQAGCRAPGESVGLAFSGGGIRSATFNLGVIQALAQLRLLSRFDYLSTISGGGYIGGWLSTFIKRYAGGSVEKAENILGERKEALEHRSIRFLRAYSNYLTPRMGLNGDTLTAVATYLRNLLLNLTVLITLLGALLLLPRVAALAGRTLVTWGRLGTWYEPMVFCLLIVATIIVALNLLHRPEEPAAGAKPERRWFTRPWALAAGVDLPVLAGAAATVCYYVLAASTRKIQLPNWVVSGIVIYVVLWVVSVLVASLAAHGASRTISRMRPTRDKAPWAAAFIVFSVFAGALGGLLLYGVASAIAGVPTPHRVWVAAVLGPPAVILAIAVMITAHIGLMSRRFSESDREVWSVFGARLLRLAALWAIFFGIALYGPVLIDFAADWVRGLGGLAWIASTLFGVLAGRSGHTGGKNSRRWVELLTRIAPYIFVLGLLLALSWGLHRALAASYASWWNAGPAPAKTSVPAAAPGLYLHADPTPGAALVTVADVVAPSLWARFVESAAREYWGLQSWFFPGYALLVILAATLAAMLVMASRININLFSLHHFYRNRLARCYLGATHPVRRPQPLTGFDPGDDIRLAELAAEDGKTVQKPMHILGTAINLNRGRQLAWQNRRAASFAFTPLYAGYEPASRLARGGFRPSAEYGRSPAGDTVRLATAIAISGAAASPNMGYHTSPAVAFLMTVFNVRLGHWCGDPRRPRAWRHRDPSFSLRYWLAELTGSADQDTPFVSLSDGGHFENLGVYELVRRRCRVILASDAGADPGYAFEDLANAIRKCWTDFGVAIEFRGATPVEDIRPAGPDKPSVRHYALADIHYPGGAEPGVLVYWKASLTDELPPDITQYRRVHEDFPHETTADQFFDESQFESYRHLGYEVALRSIREMQDANQLPPALEPRSAA